MPRYIWNLFVLFSQLINTLIGGDPIESFSQRTARAYWWHKKYNNGQFWHKWFIAQKNLIDLLFYNKLWKIEEDHTLNSIKGERGAGEVWNWNRRK